MTAKVNQNFVSWVSSNSLFSFVRYKYISKKQPTDTDKVFLNYSGTLLIWSLPGKKNLTVLTVSPY